MEIRENEGRGNHASYKLFSKCFKASSQLMPIQAHILKQYSIELKDAEISLGGIKPEFGKRCKICRNVMHISHENDTEKSGGISRGNACVNGGRMRFGR